jgi:hypothetical protein
MSTNWDGTARRWAWLMVTETADVLANILHEFSAYS